MGAGCARRTAHAVILGASITRARSAGTPSYFSGFARMPPAVVERVVDARKPISRRVPETRVTASSAPVGLSTPACGC
jgi:hypothetical protein